MLDPSDLRDGVRGPVSRASSEIGCGASFGYMQLDPRNSSLRTPTRAAASITFNWMRRLSERNSAGLLLFARMPPTFAAARTTYSGRLRS
jgi:hypothetical protein